MNKLILTTAILFLTLLAVAQTQKAEDVCYNPNLVKDTTKKSIKSMAVGVIGQDSIKISYHSPGVRRRIVWGGLVPFGEVWVTGAHDATSIVIDKPFAISGKKIPAGKYAFFTIPGKDLWTVIINKQWKQHLATEYDEKEDVVRVKVKPNKTSHTERLQYYVVPVKGKEGKIAMAWEKIRIELPITIL